VKNKQNRSNLKLPLQHLKYPFKVYRLLDEELTVILSKKYLQSQSLEIIFIFLGL